MSYEDESWKEKFSNSKEGNDRDGYRPQQNGNNRTGGFSRSGRPLRPRINRSATSGTTDGTSRPVRSARPVAVREGGYSQSEGRFVRRDGNYQPHREGGPQPRREGASQPRQHSNRAEGFKPRSNYNQEGGYQPRREGGFQPRPHSTREGAYQSSQGGNGQKKAFGNRRPKTGNYNPNAKYNMKKQIEYKERNYDPNAPIRLNRFLANAGVCSRREADTFIQAGVVSVNGQVVTELGTKVLRSDSVMFHDQAVSMEKKVYVLLNKPKDCVTTSDDPKNRKTVMEIVKDACRERIYPVGRLDRNTTGVLLLTNDGELASKLTHPQYKKKKIYHVHCDKVVTPEDIRRISEGIMLDDGEIHADAIDYASPTDRRQVGIEIHSGRNRIVRRIFEHLGYRVVKLDRVYFAGLTKKNVRRGDWRFLTEREVSMLQMGAFE